MGWPTAKRRLIIPALLIGCGLVVCGWQVEEHVRFRTTARDALINRGRDITSTLGVLVSAQRRGGYVAKDRLESALAELIRPQDLESVAILSATGDVTASAGKKVELTPEMLQAKGVYWRDSTVTIMNIADLGVTNGEDGARPRTAIVVSGGFRPPQNRRPPDARPPNADSVVESAAPSPPSAVALAEASVPAQPSPPIRPRFAFGRPAWMSPEEYDQLIQKQGVHSLVLSLSTAEMRRAISADLLLRSLVSLLAMGGAIASMLAWGNVARNAELQIRLVKAGEMNAHLKEMNLAAAGLAHETRNPLNLIRGLAQMVAMQSESSPKLKEHAATIIEEADRVTVQLNEFINYSKPREAQMAPVQVARLVADVARTLLPDLEEKRIQLEQPASDLCIEADEQLLRQALFNVLLNATQAVAPGGRICVRLTLVNSGEAMLEVSDDGPGVPAADRALIFKPNVTMRPKGVGLGLAIVAQIAAVHHWEVTCIGREPQGAVFRFNHLKLAAPTA
jgi:signal transduction histidine kinase